MMGSGEVQHVVAHNPPRRQEEAGGTAHALKDQHTFAVLSHGGDVVAGTEHGVYHRGARHLSRLRLSVDGQAPLLLGTAVRRDDLAITANLTNPDRRAGPRVPLDQGAVHIARTSMIVDDTYQEELVVTHFGPTPVYVDLRYDFAADFRDIFEVRGVERPRPGPAPEIAVKGPSSLRLIYRGHDEVTRATDLSFSVPPAILEEAAARFSLRLEPRRSQRITLAARCRPKVDPEGHRLRPVLFQPLTSIQERRSGSEVWPCTVETDNALFDRWIERSRSDLLMLSTDLEAGRYLYAGLPWFSAVFGRDGLISALQTLWCAPSLAAGTLRVLAAEQASELDEERDAEPGKIPHELRDGEMATLGEHPFSRYFGSVDATPLFVILAAAYFERTGDEALLDELWPNVRRALAWLDEYGDRDGDDLIEYPRSSQGLLDQGWKDSPGCIVYEDGTTAQGAIALCEVQAYAYEARLGAARLARRRGDHALADVLVERAARAQVRFLEQFWCPDLGTYALALDGHKRPCRVRSSNAGHCLRSGIAPARHAKTLARTLLSPDLYSGWGVRTLSAQEEAYNPMAYHQGTVWPHDTALIADGLGQTGFTDEAAALLGATFAAAVHSPLLRLPELFCGFPRREEEAPTPYPSACSPQAWAAGAPFLMLAASLGMTVLGDQRRVRFRHPRLPAGVGEVTIRDLSLGDSKVDLLVHRQRSTVGVSVLKAEGPMEVVVVP